MTKPRQGRHRRKISLLTELESWLGRVSKNMSRRWRWKPPAETQRLATLYERKQAALAALKQSLLPQAITGEL